MNVDVREVRTFNCLTLYSISKLFESPLPLKSKHQLVPWGRVDLRKLIVAQHFMESEGSLPCLQESATDPYPERD
jgi:hypothetical protein